MGCPAREVTGGLSGSALMRNLDHAEKLIEATVEASSVPVTLKMRLGWDHGSLNAPELARRAEAAGITLVTVHGRTRCQFYGGKADWSAIARVREAISIPLIANGDGNSVEDAREMLAKSGADGVMIGRGAYGRPWWPGVIAEGLDPGSGRPEPSLSEEAEIFASSPAHSLRTRDHITATASPASTSAGPSVVSRNAISSCPRRRPSGARRCFAATTMMPSPRPRGALRNGSGKGRGMNAPAEKLMEADEQPLAAPWSMPFPIR
jgi:hypothetical protein